MVGRFERAGIKSLFPKVKPWQERFQPRLASGKSQKSLSNIGFHKFAIEKNAIKPGDRGESNKRTRS